MINDGLLLLLTLMTLLLVMFVYAVIMLAPQDAVRTEPPVLNLPAPSPPPLASPWLQTAAAGQPGHTASPARHLDALPTGPSAVPRRRVSGRPPWEPAPQPPRPEP
jgi:hypothetical protein